MNKNQNQEENEVKISGELSKIILMKVELREYQAKALDKIYTDMQVMPF